MTFEQELDVYLKARSTLISIVSYEEERVIGAVKALCEKLNRALHTWDHADYLVDIIGAPVTHQQPKDALTLLETIDSAQGDQVLLLKDFHQCWGPESRREPRITRKLRTLSQELKFTRKTIIITSPTRTFLTSCAMMPWCWSSPAQR